MICCWHCSKHRKPLVPAKYAALTWGLMKVAAYPLCTVAAYLRAGRTLFVLAVCLYWCHPVTAGSFLAEPRPYPHTRRPLIRRAPQEVSASLLGSIAASLLARLSSLCVPSETYQEAERLSKQPSAATLCRAGALRQPLRYLALALSYSC